VSAKTVAVAVDVLYAALIDDELRAKVAAGRGRSHFAKLRRTDRPALPGAMALRVSVSICTAKGDSKSQIVVQHMKIPDAGTAANLKEYWAAALDRLKGVLE
jgi:hypothetical protein